MSTTNETSIPLASLPSTDVLRECFDQVLGCDGDPGWALYEFRRRAHLSGALEGHAGGLEGVRAGYQRAAEALEALMNERAGRDA